MSGLQGQVALVTGGAGGLGSEICRMLLAEGVTVVIGDVRAEQTALAIDRLRAEGNGTTSAADVRKVGVVGGTAVRTSTAGTSAARGATAPAVDAVELDLTGARSAERAVETVLNRHGHLDILINNAGIDITLPVHEIEVADWDRIMGVNLRGPFLLARLVFPTMQRQGGGQIVNITSTAAKRAWANASAYHASKWGLLGLSHALHVEGRAAGIGVTAIVAGGMRTPFLFDRFPDLDPDLLQEPSSVANAVRFVLTQPAGTVVPEITVLPIRESSWP